MSEELKFDHFKDINELLEHIDLWYREDDIEYTRWFGLEDLYNLKIYITSLQQKIEQLENIRKEAIESLEEQLLRYLNESNYKLNIFDLRKTINILNKGSDKDGDNTNETSTGETEK